MGAWEFAVIKAESATPIEHEVIFISYVFRVNSELRGETDQLVEGELAECPAAAGAAAAARRRNRNGRRCERHGVTRNGC
jgi:hypothetical protein